MIYLAFRSLDRKSQVSFIVGLNGNAKQRRKTFRSFKRSPIHKGFDISIVKEQQ